MELENKSHMRTVVHIALFAIELAKRFSLKQNFARSRRIEHSNQIQESRFTGTRRTRERHKLARVHRKIHALKDFKFFTRLGENPAKVYCLEERRDERRETRDISFFARSTIFTSFVSSL